MQVQENPMPQQAVWLSQATAAEPVGGALGEGVQVHSSPVSMVLKESTQQRGNEWICNSNAEPEL